MRQGVTVRHAAVDQVQRVMGHGTTAHHATMGGAAHHTGRHRATRLRGVQHVLRQRGGGARGGRAHTVHVGDRAVLAAGAAPANTTAARLQPVHRVRPT